MVQNDLLDVVIGVVFVWFLLSSVLSAVNEGIAFLTRSRAKHLWRGVGRLIEPELRRSGGLLDAAIGVHLKPSRDVRPFADAKEHKGEHVELKQAVQNVYDALRPRLIEVAGKKRRTKVTHVAAASLSAAVVDLARSGVYRADLLRAAHDAGWDAARIQKLEDELPPQEPGQALTNANLGALATQGVGTRPELEELYERARALLTPRDVAAYFNKNPALAAAVKRAAAAVATDKRVAAVRHEVESWFDHEMAQLSAYYRRQSRKLLAVLAVPVVLFCHANTVTIFRDLRRDASLRQAAVAAAVTETTRNSVDQALDENCTASSTTTTTSTTSTTISPTSSSTTTTTTDPLGAAVDRFRCASNILDRASRFRVGLAWHELITTRGTGKPTLQPGDVLPYLENALTDDWGYLGRLLTLVALSFGAQFWFDVLRRLTGLRSITAGTATTKPD